MNFFPDNLKWLRKQKQLNQTEVSLSLGLKRNTISNYETNHSEPDLETVLKIASFFDITVDELLSKKLEDVNLNVEDSDAGIGKNVNLNVNRSVNLNPKKTGKNTLSLVEEPRISYGNYPKVITIDSSGEENVVYVPVKARAGYLLGYGDPVYVEKLPSYRLPGMNHGTYRIFEIDGLSMFNTLHDKDKVITRWDTISNIKDDRVYVLVTENDGILVKRLINRYSDGVVICKSDNNFKGEYPPIVLDIHTIKEVWYVTDRWTKQLPSPGEFIKRVIDLEADMILLKQKLLKGH